MSGNKTKETINGEKRRTEFLCNIPVPSYLLALVAGNIETRMIGKRTGVIAEPEQLDLAAQDLENLETMLEKAEEYYFRYEWGDYFIVILPPSFPFGGMENPLLTFASPSIIVGDKSEGSGAQHEIMHSWTGNLVTNKNWENFWLNEGFTVYGERQVSKLL